MPVDILIVADDLTGAADSSVAFAQRGYNTEALLDQKHAPSADAAVVALTTESRDVEADELPDRLDVLAGAEGGRTYPLNRSDAA